VASDPASRFDAARLFMPAAQALKALLAVLQGAEAGRHSAEIKCAQSIGIFYENGGLFWFLIPISVAGTSEFEKLSDSRRVTIISLRKRDHATEDAADEIWRALPG
jgi:hypothetical protein